LVSFSWVHLPISQRSWPVPRRTGPGDSSFHAGANVSWQRPQGSTNRGAGRPMFHFFGIEFLPSEGAPDVPTADDGGIHSGKWRCFLGLGKLLYYTPLPG